MNIAHLPNISFRSGLVLKLCFIVQLLFLSGCVSNTALVESGKIYPGMAKSELYGLNVLTNQFQHPFSITATRKFYREHNLEIIAPADKSMFFVFEGVTVPSNPSLLSVHDGNGILNSYYSSLYDAELRITRIVQGRKKSVSDGLEKSYAVLRDEFSRLPVANRSTLRNYLSDIGLYNKSSQCCGYTKVMGIALEQYRDAYHPKLDISNVADVVTLLNKVKSAAKAS